MVITDQFIYIHQPKTGGSFVTNALFELYGIKWTKWNHLKLALRGWEEWNTSLGTFRIQDKHGGCNRIPQRYYGRPIFSTMRNPVDYYVSSYEFGWWKRKEWMKFYKTAPDAEKLLEKFPNLSFETYLRLMSGAFNKPANREFERPDHLGHYSTSFIRLFFKNEAADENDNQSEYFARERFREDMHEVTFLTTKNLNDQLYRYLKSLEFPEDQLQFILHKKKVLPQGKGRTKEQHWQKYYTDELKELILAKDALLYKLFPEFAISV